MKIHIQHRWDLSFPEARALQESLRQKVNLQDVPDPQAVRIVAAADISYNKRQPFLYAALVLMRLPEMQLIEVFTNKAHVQFPYVPGYLSFREVPALLPLFEKLTTDFDVLLCDAQGLAHPRRFGLACHLGVLLDKPTIGCAKSRLVGHYEPVGPQVGDFSPLLDNGEQVGIVLRTRVGVKPLFISPGHRMNCDVARHIVLRCLGKFRVPEPLRMAHLQVNQIRMHDKIGTPS